MPPWSKEQFIEQLQEVGHAHYHNKHPFHKLMNDGHLSRDQLRLWAANRYYYQKNIPIKDAILLSRCPVKEIRKKWIQRIHDHDGTDTEPGGIEKWLRLGEGIGLDRADMENESMLLPATRYAVDAYVHFVAERPWVEGVASSLTELFAPNLMRKRLAAFEEHYPWIDPEALAYFRSRPPLATRDSEHGISIVVKYCDTLETQKLAVAALQVKCDILWSQLDALYHHCVEQPDREPS